MTSHTITLLSRDDVATTFACAPDETILSAAGRADLTLPAQCGQGQCGACRGTCHSGETHMDGYNPAALPTADAAQGQVLLCRTFPRSNLTLRVDLPHADLTVPCREQTARIIALETIAHKTLRLLLQLDPDQDDCRRAEFEPGQYMELINADGLTRAYSLANTSNWSGELEFMIKVQPHGTFSTWLETRAKTGQTLTVRGPQGSFHLHDETGLRPRWFVAGGTGLAPLLSMLRRMADYGEPHPTRLYFGVNHDDEIFAQPQLAELAQALPGLQIHICVMSPSPAWTQAAGTPITQLRADLASNAEPDIYVCGPPGLIAAVRETAAAAGLGDDRIFAEMF